MPHPAVIVVMEPSFQARGRNPAAFILIIINMLRHRIISFGIRQVIIFILLQVAVPVHKPVLGLSSNLSGFLLVHQQYGWLNFRQSGQIKKVTFSFSA